jgi:chromosome segregation ATPase
VATGPEASLEARANGDPSAEEQDSSCAALERRITELTRALSATRGRESDFRQAAFDLNADLLRKDAEIRTLKARIEAAEALAAERAAELEDARSRASDLERLTETRSFRAVTRWWRAKAMILRR